MPERGILRGELRYFMHVTTMVKGMESVSQRARLALLPPGIAPVFRRLMEGHENTRIISTGGGAHDFSPSFGGLGVPACRVVAALCPGLDAEAVRVPVRGLRFAGVVDALEPTTQSIYRKSMRALRTLTASVNTGPVAQVSLCAAQERIERLGDAKLWVWGASTALTGFVIGEREALVSCLRGVISEHPVGTVVEYKKQNGTAFVKLHEDLSSLEWDAGFVQCNDDSAAWPKPPPDDTEELERAREE